MNRMAYNAGFENGRLCRKYSNQWTVKPTVAEWRAAYLDPVDRSGLGERSDTATMEAFVAGCEAGWRRGSGASKIA